MNARLLPDVLEALDRYCITEDPVLTRGDGLRRLAVEALKARKLLP